MRTPSTAWSSSANGCEASQVVALSGEPFIPHGGSTPEATSSLAGAAEAAFAPLAVGKLIDLDEVGVFYALDDELCDPVAAFNLERFGRIEVHQDHLELASVTRIDQARGVQTCDAMLECEPRSWLHKAGVTLWYRDRGSSRNEATSATWGQGHCLGSNKVGTSVTGGCVGRHFEVCV